MSRLIDADEFLTDESEAYIAAQLKVKDEATRLVNEVVHKKIQMLIADAPTVDAVPADFHDRCMQTEIQKRIRLEKIARLLCEGYLDMPSGCDGCPLADTMVEDDEGNGVCDLYRR